MDNTTAVIGLGLIRQQIHEYIVMNFLFDGSQSPLDDDASLAELNILDQTGVLELALFIEETYGVEVEDADVTAENFDSVNAIAEYIYLLLANA